MAKKTLSMHTQKAPDEISSQKTFQVLWDSLHLSEDVTATPPEQTVRYGQMEMPKIANFELLELPPLLNTLPRTTPEMELGKEIGKGGTAVVRIAKQLPLHREVAVKMLNQRNPTQQRKDDLKREAWITGLLEHPNIIPVHLLGCDEEGNPLLVMKRIEGVSWADCLQGKALWSREPEYNNKLEAHLQILMHICDAVHFAHTKGIIHRDLKPSNVMLDAFGEVYLMDWGIAVSLNQDHEGWLPLAKDSNGLFGTPSYMAPEITVCDGKKLSTATDIYLLGAILHEIVMGDPPHQGNSMLEVLLQAFASLPHPYPESVSPQLAAICHKAMHADPSERYTSAEEFRQALSSFLKQRNSRQLSQQALESAMMVENMFAEAQNNQKVKDVLLYQCFGQARFGLQQALLAWPENEEAHKILQQLLEQMISFEISQHNPQAASTLLSELPTPNAKLSKHVEELSKNLKKSRAELAALHQLRYETDFSVRASSRSWLMVVLAVLWGVLPFFAEVANNAGYYRIRAQDDMLYGVFFLVFHLGLVWTWRRTLLQNEVNRRLMMTLLAATVTLVSHWFVGLRLQLPQAHIMALEGIPMFAFFAMMATSLDKRLLPAVGLYGLALICVLLMPSIADYAVSLGNTLAFLWSAWIWRGDAKETPTRSLEIAHQ